ncbi:UNVERIFIED_CONTAM: hypothetical protein FKN15_000413 [Acipenser sinensis]
MSVIGEEEVRGSKAIFKEISADDEDQQPTVIESLCMSCFENGTTRLLLTKIPFFKEIIISSFTCDSCGGSNTEIQSAGKIQEQGVVYTLAIKTKQDMNREVIKSDSATTRIPELDFEIPPFTQKGCFTTSLISHSEQVTAPEVAAKIEEFVEKLIKLKDVETPFTLADDDDEEEEEQVEEKPGSTIEDMRNEIASEIPHFKEVIIMATNCDSCGHRTNEVKSGGATEKQGTKITLHITDPSDMTRDLLKSETCSILIPELEFELGMAAVGGKFTTLEGLLKDIKHLIVSKNPFTLGDSSNPDLAGKLQLFGKKIDQIIALELDAHIVLDDPAGSSYLQNVYAPDPDPEMKTEHYERTFEQNEDLGLNDMKTEGYLEGQSADR